MATLDKKYKLAAGFSASARHEVGSEVIEKALHYYEQGRYTDAWHVVEPHGPMQSWKNPEALVFGCRLAGNLAASRLASLLIKRAARTALHDPQVVLHYSYHIQEFRGVVACWHHALSFEAHVAEHPHVLADLKAIRARIAGQYRDFDTAWKLWNEADAINPGSAWLHEEKSSILLSQERREEALQAVEQSLALRLWYRPAVQSKGRILHLLRRWPEAIQFLTEANARMQSFAVASQLLTLKRSCWRTLILSLSWPRHLRWNG
jgi:tetratricopeptide (TPR) repeat protein